MTAERPAPRSGARVELTLRGVDDREARYSATAAFSGTQAIGDASVSLADGAVSLSLSPPAPDALHAFVVAVLRRAWASRREDPAPWPSRITRWRG
ncbi:MAG: hypothetical protein IT374_12255 [Polyangiaceae bacterium]|nr:hypothetical protein [Polyangiaceae bacterium]